MALSHYLACFTNKASVFSQLDGNPSSAFLTGNYSPWPLQLYGFTGNRSRDTFTDSATAAKIGFEMMLGVHFHEPRIKRKWLRAQLSPPQKTMFWQFSEEFTISLLQTSNNVPSAMQQNTALLLKQHKLLGKQ